MPEIIAESETGAEVLAAEEAKQEAAKAALIDETAPPQETPAGSGGDVPEEVKGVYDKFKGNPVELARAYKQLQAEYTRVKQGGEPKAEEEAAPPAEQEPAKEQDPAVIQDMLEAIRGTTNDELRQYQATALWAQQNISEDRREAYNQALSDGQKEVAVAMWKAIQFDHLQATGWEPRLAGGRQTAPEVPAFRSQGEVTAAMSDPRYSPRSSQFDEAYHRDVMKRLAASPGVLEQVG